MTTRTIDELRDEIAQLTGSLPDSTNAKHLAARIAALRKKVQINVYVTTAQQDALARLAETDAPPKAGGRPLKGATKTKRPNLSGLIRIALAEYARSHGHDHTAMLLEEVVGPRLGLDEHGHESSREDPADTNPDVSSRGVR